MNERNEEVRAMKIEKGNEDEREKGDMTITPLYNNTFSCP